MARAEQKAKEAQQERNDKKQEAKLEKERKYFNMEKENERLKQQQQEMEQQMAQQQQQIAQQAQQQQQNNSGNNKNKNKNKNLLPPQIGGADSGANSGADSGVNSELLSEESAVDNEERTIALKKLYKLVNTFGLDRILWLLNMARIENEKVMYYFDLLLKDIALFNEVMDFINSRKSPIAAPAMSMVLSDNNGVEPLNRGAELAQEKALATAITGEEGNDNDSLVLFIFVYFVCFIFVLFCLFVCIIR